MLDPKPLIGAVMVLLAPSLAAAQQGWVVGTVTSTTGPVAVAEVSALQGPAVKVRGLTDARGNYRLTLQPGTYTLRITMPGYQAASVDAVAIAANTTTRQEVVLTTQPISLEHISVTAQRKPEKATAAPAALSVIDAQRVAVRPTATPLDHLQTIAGVDIVESGIQARNVVTRGFNEVFGTGLLMLSDFRYAALPSLRANVPYFMTPVNDDIERIEVLLGPASAAYGPNSADGVVHVLTKSPFNSAGTSASLALGERSLVQLTARHAAIVSDKVAYKISMQRLTADDWSVRDTTELKPRDAAIERYSGEARVDVRAGSGTDLVFTVGSTLSGNAVEQTGIGNSQIRDYRYDFAQARMTRGEFFAQAFVNAAHAGKSFQLQTLEPIKEDSRVYAAQAQYGNALGSRAHILYGIDVSLTDPRTQGSINGRNEDDDRYTETGLYAQSDVRISPRLSLVGAARIDKHSRMSGIVLSPRLGAVFQAREGHNFRLTYNRAFQNPTSTDLFLDLVAARLDPLPFALRAQGVPRSGFKFRRDCTGGICVKSPFALASGFIPADATAFWPAVVAVMQSAGVDLSALPAPTKNDVRSDLRVLDLATFGFRPVAVSDIRDIDALEPNVSNTVEAGYKGLMRDRFLLATSVYFTRRDNFQGPLQVETPNLFLNTADLTAYLSRFMPSAQAQQLAAGIGGLPQNAAATGIPLATVSPDGRLGGSDIIMTYRNTGRVDLWGAEFSGEALLNDRWSAAATFSWISDDFIPQSEAGGFADIALNAPRKKGTLSVAYRDRSRGFFAEARTRLVDSFPMTSGVWVGRVAGYNVIDATASAQLSFLRGATVTLTGQNLADQRHAEFFGAPRIGRLLSARLQYAF